jgi:cell division protein FtsW (lipid II flippase)
MWDLKRQIIWLVVGISFGTFIVYMDAHDEMGHFEKSVFAFWEIILLAIILTLFYLYSRKQSGPRS